mmetsp:Transcript_72452/g.172699  ORF Transcript_72452/g.172699 Transcript_72452/m.172699 type:complete len:1395 (+) Transcript_72452:123-4307(+)
MFVRGGFQQATVVVGICIVVLIDATTSTCNCSACIADLEGKCCKFLGVTGEFASLEDDPLWQPRIEEWQRCTGASIHMTFIDEDDMQAEVEADAGVSYLRGPGYGTPVETEGAGIYDVYHIQPTFLPPVMPNIENLSPWIRDYLNELRWSDVNPLSRKAVVFNGSVRALPLDTDYVAWGYREDLLVKFGLDKPETLEEVVEVAEALHGRDLDEDGEEGDFGMCINQDSWPILAVFLPFMATGTDFGECTSRSLCPTLEENMFFDATTMEPFFTTTAFRAALTLYRRLVMASNLWSTEPHGCREGDGFFCDRKKAYMTGRCGMFLSLPGTATRMIRGRNRPQRCANCTHPRTCSLEFLESQYSQGCSDDNPMVWEPRKGSFPDAPRWHTRRSSLPGTPLVWQRSSDTLVPCTAITCPHAVVHSKTGELVNGATYFPEGGESYALRARADSRTKEMLFEFLVHMSSLHVAETPLGGNYRISQSTAEYQQSFVDEFGWDPVEVEDLYQQTLGIIFSENYNTAQDLLILGHSDYIGSLKTSFFADYFGFSGGSGPLARLSSNLDETEQEALDNLLIANLTMKWKAITEDWGRLNQNEGWRAALSLPQLPDSTRCEYYETDMNLRIAGICTRHCPAGQFDDSVTGCVPCAAGTYKSRAGRDMCGPCDAGFFCPEGAIQMTPCGVGRSSLSGAAVCEDCPPGSHAASVVTASCSLCPPGFHQPDSGQQHCRPCPTGMFQEALGSVTCDECNATFTTKETGTTSAGHCACGIGTYFVSNTGLCHGCPTGMTCNVFNQTPLVAPGYYVPDTAARDTAQLDVYVCVDDKVCKGQAIPEDPVCRGKRKGKNCAICEQGYYKFGSGCRECTGLSYALGPSLCVIAFLASGAFQYYWNGSLKDQIGATESALMSVTFGMTLVFMQSLGVFHKLSFTFPSEFEAVLQWMGVFIFDLEAIRPSCLMPTSLSREYLTPLLLPLGGAGCFVVWGWISKLLCKITKGRLPAFERNGLINSIGLLAQALYISLATSTLRLLECFENPNGRYTIRSIRYAECGSTEYFALLPFFAAGTLLYIVGFFAIGGYWAWVAPRKYIEPGFRTRIHFMVFKYRPNRWWHGILQMARSLALALVLVIFPSDPFKQFLGMSLVLIAGVYVHLYYLPYHDRFCNALESSEMAFLLTVLAVGSYFMSERDLNSVEAQSYMGILLGVVATSFATLFAVFFWAMYLAMNPTVARKLNEKLVHRACKELQSLSYVIMNTDAEIIEDIMLKGSYIDRMHVYETAGFLGLELCGIVPKRMSDRRLPKVTETVMCPESSFNLHKAGQEIVRKVTRGELELSPKRDGTVRLASRSEIMAWTDGTSDSGSPQISCCRDSPLGKCTSPTATQSTWHPADADDGEGEGEVEYL